jgi:hypothetical protein
MAVEKEWNVLDFTDLNDQLPIYDADLRALNPNKYAVRIFYKACIPMNYIDPENYPNNPLVKDADNASFVGKYLDLVDGTVIGSPVNKMSEGSSSEQSAGQYGYHGLLIADDVPYTHEAYELPDDRQLNHTNVAKWAFATGSSLATCKISDDDTYLQPYNWATNGFAYMLMNRGGFENGGVASFMVNNGALAYSVDTSANRFNLPTDDHHQSNIKYLQPLLFKPFGVAFEDHLTTHHGTEVATAGWFYCVLGVQEIGGEDPSFQIDPSVTHVTFKHEDTLITDFEMEEGVYSGYESTINTECDIVTVEVADYVELVEARFNDDALTIYSPVNNIYTLSINMNSGTNTLTLKTLDENGQNINYDIEVEYNAVAFKPFNYITLSDALNSGDPDSETIIGSDGLYTYNERMIQFSEDESNHCHATIEIEFNGNDVMGSNHTLTIDDSEYTHSPAIDTTTHRIMWNNVPLSTQPSVIKVTFDDYDGNPVTATFSSEEPPAPSDPFKVVRLHDVYDTEEDNDEIALGMNGVYNYNRGMVHFSTTFSPKAEVRIDFNSESDMGSNYVLLIDGSAYTPSPTISTYTHTATWDRVPVSPQPSIIQVKFDDYDGNPITVTFGDDE